MKRVGISVSIEPWAYIALALMILMLPAQWLLAALVSAAFHELGHLIALVLCGARIHALRIETGGARIMTGPLKTWKELVCALAGPFGGLCLVMLGQFFPRTAVCAALHSAYNLLPLYPMDGGRALKCITQMFLSERCSKWVMLTLHWSVLVMICIFCAYAAFWLRLGLIPLVFAAALIWKTGFLKFPCKRA